MVYLRHENAAFIHIPKTAGTSIHHALLATRPLLSRSKKLINLGHSTLDEILNGWTNDFAETGRAELVHRNLAALWGERNLDAIRSANFFTVVRNPINRIRSYYTFVRKYEQEVFPEAHDMNFEEFLSDSSTLLSRQRAFWPQVDYVTSSKSHPRMHIIRFEHLQEDLTQFTLHWRHQPILKHRALYSSSEHVPISNTARTLIYDRYELDFVTFGYPMPL